MGGAPVSGFTNRQVYNSVLPVNYVFSPDYHKLQDIYTKNGTDNKITSDPMYNPGWTLGGITGSESDITIVTRNPNEPSPMGIAICTSAMASFEDLVLVGYSYSGVLQKTGLTAPESFFIVGWNMGPGYSFQWAPCKYTDRSVVATPVITMSDDGKFSITCATPGATILWRPAKITGGSAFDAAKQPWIVYNPAEDILPLQPGVTVQAAAYKAGMWDSQVAGGVCEYKLATPSISIGTAPGSKFVILESDHEDLIHGVTLKFTVNGGSVHTFDSQSPVEVESGDNIIAWTAAPSASDFSDSNNATHTVT